MIKILPNNRILVRDNGSRTSKVLKPDQVSSYFETLLKEQLEAQDEEDSKISEIRKGIK